MDTNLISRAEAIEVIRSMQISLGGKEIFHPEAKRSVLHALDDIPAVDAEPVRHGRWEDIKGAIRCSECQEKPLYDYHGRLALTRWCHACGVKMWKEIKSENHRLQ
jgi:hypothetical protein